MRFFDIYLYAKKLKPNTNTINMKNFSLSSFVIELFFRLQAVTILLLLGIAVIVSIPDKITKVMELIQLSLLVAVIMLFFSIVACFLYAFIASCILKYVNITNINQLKSCVHHAGWINAVIFLGIILALVSTTYIYQDITRSTLAWERYRFFIAAFLFFIISGQMAIFWTIRSPKFQGQITFLPINTVSLIEEIGKETDKNA